MYKRGILVEELLMTQRRPVTSKCLLLGGLVFLIGCLSVSARGQSLDPSVPAPIRSNTLEGKIPARDIGDARLTDHYYAFTGVPGDLVITVNAHNLNGDIDVFTAGTLRPLLKLTLYAESTTPLTKGIYLRRREDLVLRVEARTPNDDEGAYQLSFSGSFEARAGGAEPAEGEIATPSTTLSSGTGAKKTRRVSSVGARIEEPVTEVAAAPTPEPTPAPTPEIKSAEAETKETTKPSTPAAPRTARGRRPATRRTPPSSSKPKETDTEKSETAVKTETTPEETATESKPKPAAPPPGTRRGSRSAKSAASQPTTTEPAPETGPRLIIETNDGTMINRSMSGVRRVMVENGQVVVVGKNGKVDRFLLANVVRMSIAP